MLAYLNVVESEIWTVASIMKKYNVSISDELEKEIERERKKRYIETVPEMMRILLSEHMAEKKEAN